MRMKRLLKKSKKRNFSAWSSSRGHSIVQEYNSGIWVFEDNLEPCYHQRACIKCKRMATPYEPDPCIGWLPDVKFACCGHGIKGDDYVLMNSGERMSLQEYYKRNDKI